MRTKRPGTFKKGHKKLGGRKEGTPNRINRNLIETILGAADQVGSDGRGKDGVDGYFQRLADRKEGYFAGLLRQAVQKQVPTAQPENEVVYSTAQDYRRALLDRGVHPTLLPPPPRDPNEEPPTHLHPPKPPAGWQWVLCKTNESAELDKEQPDPTVQSDLVAEKSAELDKGQPHRSLEIKNSSRVDDIAPPSPSPLPELRWEFNPYAKSWFLVPTNSPPTIWLGKISGFEDPRAPGR
jgi:hypothetical protein